ncbi:hypothetical protein DJ58_4279 [Yersinia frederiksenii ATCC 33641]|uniref:Uncharacterized protein n=1 Tax=Yersinia frederiksenii ATCC 33641 TaxID=349966 RepID=A0ABR4VW66_YERFR|nr:hypothetical protein DJ58_4279 [Yersinia frederiksenii ATCC 33641]
MSFSFNKTDSSEIDLELIGACWGLLGVYAGNLDFSAPSNGGGCHTNDRLSGNQQTTISSVKSCHITRNLFNVMKTRQLLALVTEISGVPVYNLIETILA